MFCLQQCTVVSQKTLEENSHANSGLTDFFSLAVLQVDSPWQVFPVGKYPPDLCLKLSC